MDYSIAMLVALLHHILTAIAAVVSVFQSETPCSGFNTAGEQLTLELIVAAKTRGINLYFFNYFVNMFKRFICSLVVEQGFLCLPQFFTLGGVCRRRMIK